MAEKITVPTLGESVTEATESKWLKMKPQRSLSSAVKHTLATQPVQARCTRERGHIHNQ